MSLYHSSDRAPPSSALAMACRSVCVAGGYCLMVPLKSLREVKMISTVEAGMLS